MSQNLKAAKSKMSLSNFAKTIMGSFLFHTKMLML